LTPTPAGARGISPLNRSAWKMIGGCWPAIPIVSVMFMLL
jgi:hypothetical protein